MNFIKVLKTFDIFNSEAVKFLARRALNIFLIETKGGGLKGINVSSDNSAINVNVINRPKAYKLLISAQKRIEEKRAKMAGKL